MTIGRELKKRLSAVVGPVLGGLLIAYFAYHAIEGQHGVLAWAEMNKRIAVAEKVVAGLEEERRILEHRVSLLHPDNIDPDFLEERARLLLGMVREDELVVTMGPASHGNRTFGAVQTALSTR